MLSWSFGIASLPPLVTSRVPSTPSPGSVAYTTRRSVSELGDELSTQECRSACGAGRLGFLPPPPDLLTSVIRKHAGQWELLLVSHGKLHGNGREISQHQDQKREDVLMRLSAQVYGFILYFRFNVQYCQRSLSSVSFIRIHTMDSLYAFLRLQCMTHSCSSYLHDTFVGL